VSASAPPRPRRRFRSTAVRGWRCSFPVAGPQPLFFLQSGLLPIGISTSINGHAITTATVRRAAIERAYRRGYRRAVNELIAAVAARYAARRLAACAAGSGRSRLGKTAYRMTRLLACENESHRGQSFRDSRSQINSAGGGRVVSYLHGRRCSALDSYAVTGRAVRGCGGIKFRHGGKAVVVELRQVPRVRCPRGVTFQRRYGEFWRRGRGRGGV